MDWHTRLETLAARQGALVDLVNDDEYLTAVRDAKNWPTCAVGEALGLTQPGRPAPPFDDLGVRFTDALESQDFGAARRLLDKIYDKAYGA